MPWRAVTGYGVLAGDHVTCGVIPGRRHVHPETLRITHRVLGSDLLYLTTDAVSGGLPRLGGGEISGSTLTMDEATASTAAALIGIRDCKGRISPGYDANITVTSPDLTLESVWKGARRLFLRLRLDRLRR